MPSTIDRALFQLSLFSLLLGCVDASAPQPDSASAPAVESPASPQSAEATRSTKTASAASESAATASVAPPSASVEQQSKQTSSSRPRLDIASRAPALQIAKWVKGKPIESYQPEKIYVIEFWATWCGPCRVGMPHLSALQEAYGEEVTFIGVTDESERVVQAFLRRPADQTFAEPGQTWNDLMLYTVALDANGASSRAFLAASGQAGIPTAFVVGFDGIIEWIGHPMAIDEPLKQIAARTWDRDAALAEQKNAVGRAEHVQVLQRELMAAVQDERWDDVLAHLDELSTELPASPKLKIFRLSILNEAGRTGEANRVLEELVDEADQNAQMLSVLAWSIAANEASEELLLRSALIGAQRACELTGYANADTLDTLARVYSELGDLEQAISWQTRATQAAPEVANLQETLQDYISRAEQPAQ